MKYLGSAALSLLLLFALASCYWMGNIDTGSVTMDFSQIQARQSGDIVRVYLLANGFLFSAGGGQPFAAEVPLGADYTAVVKIDGLPVGPSYKALVGSGYIDQDIFYVDYYGESEEFDVSAGDNATVPTTLGSVNYYWGFDYSTDLMGKNLVGVAAGSFYVYAAEANKIHAINSSTFAIPDSYDLAVISRQVNGLSQDNSGLFLDAFMDSNMGIVPFDYYGEGWDFDLSFSSMLEGKKEIEESDLFPSGSDQAIFFRRENGIGGAFVSSDEISSPDLWKWVNLDVSGARDMVLGENLAYFATDHSAFILPTSFLTDPTPSISEHRTNFSAPAEILSLGCIPRVGAPDVLFMGTTNGVWQADVDEAKATIGNLTQIPETAGETIEMIEVSSSGSYQAFLSRYFLYIRNGSYVDKYPFFAILPGKVTGMTWFGDSRLYISGTEGLSVLYISST